MLLPRSSPPRDTASKRIRSEKPSAAPMITCWMVITTPAADKAATSGMATSGATRTATAPARITRTRTGTDWAPNAGATMKQEPMRTNGQKSSSSQPSSCFVVRVIMTCNAVSADQPRNAHDELTRIADDHLQHPRARDGERERERDQLRDEGQGHLIDRGGRLECADDDAGDQRGEEQRRRQGE